MLKGKTWNGANHVASSLRCVQTWGDTQTHKEEPFWVFLHVTGHLLNPLSQSQRLGARRVGEGWLQRWWQRFREGPRRVIETESQSLGEMAMDQYLYIPFLGGYSHPWIPAILMWTTGVLLVLTHPQMDYARRWWVSANILRRWRLHQLRKRQWRAQVMGKTTVFLCIFMWCMRILWGFSWIYVFFFHGFMIVDSLIDWWLLINLDWLKMIYVDYSNWDWWLVMIHGWLQAETQRFTPEELEKARQEAAFRFSEPWNTSVDWLIEQVILLY